MIVLIEQRRDLSLLFRRIECRGWHVVNVYWIAVERPQKRADITFIIQPRTHPLKVSTRNELARHLAVRGRQGLEEMKHARVANSPGDEHEHECEGEQHPGD